MAAMEGVLEHAFAALKDKNWRAAEHHARHILRADPMSAEALYVLGVALSDHGDDAGALRLYRQAIHCNPEFLAPYHPLSRAYCGMERLDQAAEIYRSWAEVDPGNPIVAHMIAAVTGQDVPARCSEDYVQHHFNAYAGTFDDKLVSHLAYKGPEAIAVALEQYAPLAQRSFDVLDAGCGTGLCGPAIRPWCRTLIGVDLADKMLERARARGCYDELVVSELCVFMESRQEQFDAVVSSDVLIYFGALERVMANAHLTLRSGGAFIYTLEALTGSGAEPYRLTTSGRYAHRESYLRDVMSAVGFEVMHLEQQPLRWERGKQVTFHCCVARKAPQEVA